jgi:cytochrome c oxidase assembly factor 1
MSRGFWRNSKPRQQDAPTTITNEGPAEGETCEWNESGAEEDFNSCAKGRPRSSDGKKIRSGAPRYVFMRYSVSSHSLIDPIDVREGGMRWIRTVPIFLVLLVSATLAIFNYQKSSSSVISSTLYSLRTSDKAREYLGDDIYFAHKMPWIWGEMNQLHGRIDIQFEVKGNKNSGTMRFKSFRATRMGMFETTEWSLETKDGVKLDLLDGSDAFKRIEIDDQEPKVVGRGTYAPNLSG